MNPSHKHLTVGYNKVIITSNAVKSNSIHRNDLVLLLGLTEYSVENCVVLLFSVVCLELIKSDRALIYWIIAELFNW